MRLADATERASVLFVACPVFDGDDEAMAASGETKRMEKTRQRGIELARQSVPAERLIEEGAVDVETSRATMAVQYVWPPSGTGSVSFREMFERTTLDVV